MLDSGKCDNSPPTTSCLVNWTTLMECADPHFEGVLEVYHHIKFLSGSVASYLIYADVRIFR